MVARARITVRLTDDEWEALIDCAQDERRDPREQAGLFVREGLLRAGWLAYDESDRIRERLAKHGDGA